jgi:hypothetical protein
MDAKALTTLEQRLTALQTELKRIRAANRALEQGWFRRQRVQRRAGFCGVFALGLAAALVDAPLTTAAQGKTAAAQAPRQLTVRAPFRVVDDNDRVVLTVTAGDLKAGFGRAVGIHSLTGDLAVHFGISAANAEPQVAALRGDGKYRFDIGPQGFRFNNDLGNGIVHLGSQIGAGAGYLMIGDAGGTGMVEAVVGGDRTGLMRAYPIGGAQPISPSPYFIRGGQK